MARTNIAYQICSAINDAFKPGASRHIGKHTGQNLNQVYSYGEKRSLQQVAFEFKDFMKKEHPNIKFMRDVKPDHWQSFLNHKAQTCSTETLKNYVSRIGKIEVLCQNKFKFKSNWRDNILVPASEKTPLGEKQRVQIMTKEDYAKISEHIKNSKSKAVPAIQLCRNYGLRACEVARLKISSVNLKKKELEVLGKGGRLRYLSIRPKDVPLFKSLIEGKPRNDKLIGIKQGSIQTFLNRTMDKVGIKNKYPKTGIHAIRKMRAQEEYDKVRAQGYSKREAMDHVSQFLGHGKGRYDVFNAYVQNQH